MSKTTDHIINSAEAIGVPVGYWLAEQARISRDEEAFRTYWADNRLCHQCGWQGIPEVVQAGGEAVEFCPGCGGAETFNEGEADHDEA